MALSGYTTRAKVSDELPTSLPTGIDNDYIDARILEATAEVDGAVGPLFSAGYNSNTQKFDPDNVPAIIDRITRELTVALILRRIKQINRDGDEPSGATSMENRAYRMLKRIREGDLEVIDPDGAQLGSSSDVYHTHANAEPAMRRARYDDEGELIDDENGSVDTFDW